jgi:hypothetical protein
MCQIILRLVFVDLSLLVFEIFGDEVTHDMLLNVIVIALMAQLLASLSYGPYSSIFLGLTLFWNAVIKGKALRYVLDLRSNGRQAALRQSDIVSGDGLVCYLFDVYVSVGLVELVELEGEIFVSPPILDVFLRLHVLTYIGAPFLISLTGTTTQTQRGSLLVGSGLMLNPYIPSLLVQAHFVVIV